MKRFVGIGAEAAVAYLAYYLFGWIGVTVWAVFLIGCYATQLTSNQRIIMNTLLSRLPDRCTFCHREIVDEGGIIDEDSIYHEACLEKLESLEQLRKEAGVPLSEAIQRPKVRSGN
jgi:hypothetical protein